MRLLVFFMFLNLNHSLAYGGKAHSHGLGLVNVAMSGSEIQVEIEVPMADAVGFEYAARTKAEKKKISELKQGLKKASFIEAPAAGCDVAVGEIKGIAGEGGHHGKHHGKHHDHHHGKKKKKEVHSDVHVTYSIKCKQAPKGTLDLFLTKVFPKLKKVRVQTVGINPPFGGKKSQLNPLKIAL